MESSRNHKKAFNSKEPYPLLEDFSRLLNIDNVKPSSISHLNTSINPLLDIGKNFLYFLILKFYSGTTLSKCN